MIIVDNSVLSAFTRMNLLKELENLFRKAYVTKSIIDEYSLTWSNKIPKFIVVEDSINKIDLPTPPTTLSLADLSMIHLAINKSLPIASDDLPLRKYAKSLNIKVTGSLGILRSLWNKKIIADKEKYLQLVTDIQKDIYLSDKLIKWALKDI